MSKAAIIYLVLSGISLLLNAYEHGKPRKNGNFWHAFFGSVIVYTLLMWGGFFN